MLRIGDVNVPVPVALAPMAGVTDLPYRDICRDFMCGLTCTELISAKAIKYNNKNTEILLKTNEREHPSMIQLFGSDPDILAEIAKRVEELDFDIIDLNMGCPVHKVVNNGEGSALMKDPLLAGRIIGKMASAVKKPVTVKIRSGFSANAVNAPEIAHIAQESGAAAVTVHARTREQYYSGEADRSVIKAVKERVSIPVIGNGDIRNGDDALSMMLETGCDGVMIGRAARGNPWIFAEVYRTLRQAQCTGTDRGMSSIPQQAQCTEADRGMSSIPQQAQCTEADRGISSIPQQSQCTGTDRGTLLYGGKGCAEPVEAHFVKPSIPEKCDMLLRHLHGLVEFKGEYTAVREMRKHFGWYMAGERNASALRREVNLSSTAVELERIVERLRV